MSDKSRPASGSPLGDNEIQSLSELPPEKERQGNSDLSDWMKLVDSTEAAQENNYSPMLPYMLNLRGMPYSLDNHFVMEPLFKTKIPWKTVYKCGRQVSKSTTLAAQGFVQTATTPYFNSLYVLPLYEMTRRFSSNVVRPFIDESSLKNLVIDSKCEQSVLQKSFINNSIMFFTFAFLNCDRTRGISADKMAIDEVQDMDWEFIPIIRETLSASKWGLEQYSGTPKTFDNTIEALWDDSSKAEWFIRCGCGHWNIPTTRFDAMRMLGPVSNIREYGTALVCAKCGKPIDARSGQWVHAHPDRYSQFTGYHVPQIVLPMHYGSEKKWTEFLRKRDKSAPNIFLNECMGESCDVGTKLVTQEELRNACILHKLDFNTCRNLDFSNNYIQRIMGVDWGGGGEDEVSFTTIAIVGLTPDYRYELIWGERMHATVSDVEEVKRIQEVFHIFQCHFLAHDFGGSGSVHETLLIQSGFPLDRVIPFSYVKTGGKSLIRHHAPTASSSRHFYSLDKTWSLMLLCLLLKTQHLALTEFESSKDLVEDFLHIYEDKTETRHAGDILTIKRTPKLSDDFVHSVNFACCGHYHLTQKPPKFAEQFGLTLTDEQRQVAQPSRHVRF
jgi:hypothetical protein